MNYILYNPFANVKGGEAAKNTAKAALNHRFPDMKEIDLSDSPSHTELYKTMTEEDNCVIVGGDGTLNRLANDLKDFDVIKPQFYTYIGGTGNDFVNDLRDKNKIDKDNLVYLNPYLVNLPKVIIDDKVEMVFLNNVAFGLDGDVCREADDQKARGAKKINYTTIAMKLALFTYHPAGATIKVDDKEIRHEKTWLASAFNGRFYGGGMMMAPPQERTSDLITMACLHTACRIRGLMIFASVFKGNHVKVKNRVDIIQGRRIEVTYDKPTSVQVDGETFRNVKHIIATK